MEIKNMNIRSTTFYIKKIRRVRFKQKFEKYIVYDTKTNFRN